MTNRFRKAIKNAGEEILTAGKQAELVYNDDDSILESIEAKNIESDIVVAVKKEEVNVMNFDKNFMPISAFLKEKVGNYIFELRINKLKEILNALINQNASEKPILITDYKVNMKNWIEAIKYSVPESVKSLLTFKTSPNQISEDCEDCLVYNNAMNIKGTVTSFDKGSEIYVFDFTKTTKNTRNDSIIPTQYSEIVQIGFLNNDIRFQEFKVFFDTLEYKKIDLNIDNCLILYYFTLTGVEHLDYSSILEALQFAEKYCGTEVYKKLFTMAAASLNLSEEMANMIIKLMMKVSKDLGEKEYYLKTYGFMFDYIQKLLKSNKGNDITNIYNFYNNLNKLNDKDFKVVDFITNEKTIAKFSEYTVNKDSRFTAFYLTVILENLSLNNATWKSNTIYLDFIEKGMNTLLGDFEAVKTVIDSVGENIDYKANLIIMYYNMTKDNEEKNNQIVEFYAEKEKEHSKGNKDMRATMILIPNGQLIVFDEFKHNLKDSTNKIQFFWDYKKNMFDKIVKFKEEYFSKAIELYLKAIKRETFYNDEWTKVLNMISNNQITLEDEVLIFFIEDYENGVPLAGADIVTQVNLKDISRIRKARNIVTSNSNTLMLEFGAAVKNSKTSEQISSVINSKFPQIKNTSTEKLEEFFEWCVDLLISNASSDKNNLVEFYNKMVEKLEEDNKEFELIILGPESLARFKASLDKKNIKKVVFYLQIALKLIVKKKASWDSKGEIEDFIKNCVDILSNSKELIEHCLKEIEDHAEYYAQVFSRYAYCVKSSTTYLPLFLKKSSSRGEEWSQDIRKSLDACENGESVLLEEFKFKLEEAKDKTGFFWEYVHNVFGELTNYFSSKLDDAFELYLLQIDKSNNYSKECEDILAFLIENKLQIKNIISTKIILEYEKGITVVPPSARLEGFLDKVSRYKKQCGISTVPGIIELACFAIKLEHIKNSEDIINLSEKYYLDFKGLDKPKYVEYIEWSLDLISKNINMMEHDDLLNKIFCIDEFKETYYIVYNSIVVKLLDSETQNLSKSQVQNLILKHGGVLEIVAQLVTLYYNKCVGTDDNKEAVSLFVKLVNDGRSFNLKQSSLEILKYFSGLANGNELIFEEFKYSIGIESNKVAFFTSYWNKLGDDFEDYTNNYYAKAVEYYLPLIKDGKNYSQVCYELLEGLKEKDFNISQEVLTEMVVISEKKVIVATPTVEQNKIIANLSEAKAKWGIVTSPDIVSCVKLGARLESLTSTDEIRKVISEINIDLKNIDYTRYEEWLYWCLPNVRPAANTWQVHSLIVKGFCVDSLKNIFYTTYINVLGEELNKNQSKWVDMFGQFMIFFMKSKAYIGEEAYIQARSNVVNLLGRCDHSQVYELDKLIIIGYMDLLNKEEVALEWTQIQKRFAPSEKQEKGFFSKVFKK